MVAVKGKNRSLEAEVERKRAELKGATSYVNVGFGRRNINVNSRKKVFFCACGSKLAPKIPFA